MILWGRCGSVAAAGKHQVQHHLHRTHSLHHQPVGAKFSTGDSSDRACETGKVALCGADPARNGLIVALTGTLPTVSALQCMSWGIPLSQQIRN